MTVRRNSSPCARLVPFHSCRHKAEKKNRHKPGTSSAQARHKLHEKVRHKLHKKFGTRPAQGFWMKQVAATSFTHTAISMYSGTPRGCINTSR